MPDRIYTAYTPTSFPGAFHAAIHYERRDADGKLIKHSVIEVQPEAEGLNDKAIGMIDEASGNGGGLTRLGRMNAQVTDLMASKPKQGVDPNPPYEVIAEGDDLSSHLARMQLFADGVNRAGIVYRGHHQNSNSFASSALRAGELPPATGIGRDPFGPPGELLEFFAPGLNEPLKAPAAPIRYLSSRRVSSSPDQSGPFGDRYGNWTPPPAGMTQPAPPQISRLPIWDFPDRSGDSRGSQNPEGSAIPLFEQYVRYLNRDNGT